MKQQIRSPGRTLSFRHFKTKNLKTQKTIKS